MQATDRPVNEVGSANTANQAHIQSGTATAFDHVEQQAAQSGLSRPGVAQEIGKQQSTLSQQSRVKTGEVEQTIGQTGGTVEGDAANLKESFKDADKATSWAQSLNSHVIIPGSKSDGSDGAAVDQVRDIGLPSVEASSFKAPDGNAPSAGFTDEQKRIEAQNLEGRPLNQLSKSLGLSSDSRTYTIKSKEGQSDPKQ